MPAFNYKAMLYYQNAALKTVEGNFVTEFCGTNALEALVTVLRLSHEQDGELPEVGLMWMHVV